MQKINDFQARLQELRDRYTESLPEKIAGINEQQKILNKKWDWDAAATLHRMTHSLAGSGGSFGYTQLGAQAREIEIELKVAISAKSIPEADKWDELVAKLNGLQDSIQLPSAENDGTPIQANHYVTETQKSIYLLEDDRAVVEELSQQLGRFGYQVSTFSTVEALNEAICENKPLALITGIILNNDVLAGIKAVRNIRALYGDAFSILFLSPRSDFEIRLEVVRAGGDAYFVKPIEITSFVDQLDRLTQLRSSEPNRILIVDDDKHLAAHYELILNQAGMDAMAVNDPKKLLDAMIEHGPELILMDLYMPTCSGLELAKMIRQQEAYIGIPIIFLSSESDEAKQFNTMRMGRGDGFLTKPIDDACLVESIRPYAKRARVLNSMMVQDGLTRLLSHTKIKELLDIEVSRAERDGTQMAYAMIDIDKFKAVNDTYGHLVGDYVIKGLARLLKHRFRKSDIVGRYGGEEFAVILPDCSLEAAVKIVEQVRVSFEKISFTHEDVNFSVTFSAGVAVFPDAGDAQQLTQSADDALYQAKANGRNCTVKASTKKMLEPDD
ncbi:diguanylate cyclase [Pseudomonadota bacterium]